MEARILRPDDGRSYAVLHVEEHRERTSSCRARELQRELDDLAGGSDKLIARYLAIATVLWGVFDGGVLVGTMAVSRRVSAQVWPYLWAWGLYVRRPYRGTSASRLLAEAAFVWCEQQPAQQRLFGVYDVLNVRAHRFCGRHGFATIAADAVAFELPKPPGFTLVERPRGI